MNRKYKSYLGYKAPISKAPERTPLRIVLSVLAGLLVALVLGFVLIPCAYQIRGLFAIGGEWLLIISAGIFTAGFILHVRGKPREGEGE